MLALKPLRGAMCGAIATLLLSLMGLGSALGACPTDSSIVGTVKGSVVGIEVTAECTYVLVTDVTTSLPELDTAAFLPGRTAYIAIDPAHPSYKAMLAMATMAHAMNGKVYAEVTSRQARANRLTAATF